MAFRARIEWLMAHALETACLMAIMTASTACTPAEDDGLLAIVPGQTADMDPADAGVDPDAAPDVAVPDATPPERVLVEQPPLPFPADERVMNPTFDPRSAASWLSFPEGRGARVFDHRFPFRGPALAIEPTDESPIAYGRVRLSRAPMTVSVWLGLDADPQLAPEDTHWQRAIAHIITFAPDWSAAQPTEFTLGATDEVEVVGDVVWRRFTGGVRAETLGWGWLRFAADGSSVLRIGAPSVVAEQADVQALRHRPPPLVGRPISAARAAELKALPRAPMPRPRPTTRAIRRR